MPTGIAIFSNEKELPVRAFVSSRKKFVYLK
jgi:hypothetical protein